MTNTELKQAFFGKVPVMYDGIQYRRVYEIVYRMPEDKLIISAGLLDMGGRSVVYVPFDKVKPVSDQGEQKQAFNYEQLNDIVTEVTDEKTDET